MGNINITSLKRTGYKRKGGDDKNAIKNDNIQNDYDKKSISYLFNSIFSSYC